MTRRAERDLLDLYEYLAAEHSPAARRWLNGLERAIFALNRYTGRCPLAPDATKAGWPLRRLLYGKKPDIYRILFEILEARKVVRIVTIRHVARDEFANSEQWKNKS
ncbi:MAG: type II toxin-antitoxin system RelE/ParE family toxin [Acidobacteriia bacterium]|nr:type II toxin-antitoxin system RelE/ParE family toxin [Terriglobia bacterium]